VIIEVTALFTTGGGVGLPGNRRVCTALSGAHVLPLNYEPCGPEGFEPSTCAWTK
jgi:hypothetical protein